MSRAAEPAETRLLLAHVMVRRYRPPMVDDPDIWRAANLLVKRHGSDAPSVASTRADELLGERDSEGWAVWRRILDAVVELSRTKPAPKSSV